MNKQLIKAPTNKTKHGYVAQNKPNLNYFKFKLNSVNLKIN